MRWLGHKIRQHGVNFDAGLIVNWQEWKTWRTAIVAEAVEGVLQPRDPVLHAKHLRRRNQFLRKRLRFRAVAGA
jgi:hypothetical protein